MNCIRRFCQNHRSTNSACEGVPDPPPDPSDGDDDQEDDKRDGGGGESNGAAIGAGVGVSVVFLIGAAAMACIASKRHKASGKKPNTKVRASKTIGEGGSSFFGQP